MKVLKMLLVAAGMMLLASTISAQFCGCPEEFIPYQRIWMTYDGSLLPGRASEAWCGTPEMAGRPGNAEDAMSWDGTTLGGQWRAWGMEIDAAGAGETGRDIDSLGTGWIDYVTNYDGGEFWLDSDHFGPPGSSDFTGTITYFNVGTRVSYLNGNVTGVTSNVTFNGWFTECPCCYLEFVIANTMRVWVEGQGPPPADYPPFLCGTTGELFEVCCIMASISCPNSTEETSWGAIKEMHK